MAGPDDLLRERGAGALGDVDEGHPRTLRRKGGDDGRADAAAAAGDEHGAVFQARMDRELG
jgi:hypothetical protein